MRGTLSHGGVAGEKWYLEIKLLNIGTPGQTQNLELGLIDVLATNILSRPPPSDTSEITNLSLANYLLAYSRTTDGAVYTSYPASVTHAGGLGSGPSVDDVYGFAWDVGTSIKVYRNNALGLTVPYTATVPLFPYFAAGATLVNGPNSAGTDESALIQAGRKQQTYSPPAGYHSWG